MATEPHTHGQVLGHGVAWAFALAPFALGAVVWGLPHLLEILGWICQLMRDFAAVVKG